jgi:hypothetical protein
MAGDRLHDIVKTKLKWVGAEGDDNERIGALSKEDQELYESIAKDYVGRKISSRVAKVVEPGEYENEEEFE